ncbi:hypothetical protein [Enterobacter cloacae]
MEYSDAFMRQHEEMCRVTGCIVFALAIDLLEQARFLPGQGN